MGAKRYWGVVRDAGRDWMDDKAPMLGAALAYYTLFAIAPILVIAIAVAGLAFGEAAARGQLMGQIQGLIGPSGARAVQSMVAHAGAGGGSIVAVALGVVALLVGATGAFLQLQQALDVIWEVERKGGGVTGFIRERLLSFGMVLGIGFLLLVSLVVSAAISGLQDQLAGAIPGSAVVWQMVNLAVSLVLITLLFAVIYRYLPDVELAWSDVWVGAGITAVLFTGGKYLIGLYLGHSSTASSFGAAGSVVVLMIWIYYSAQIVLYGAEVTQVYATRYGSGLVPSENARRINRLGAGGPERRTDQRREEGSAEPGPVAAHPGAKGERRYHERRKGERRRLAEAH